MPAPQNSSPLAAAIVRRVMSNSSGVRLQDLRRDTAQVWSEHALRSVLNQEVAAGRVWSIKVGRRRIYGRAGFVSQGLLPYLAAFTFDQWRILDAAWQARTALSATELARLAQRHGARKQHRGLEDEIRKMALHTATGPTSDPTATVPGLIAVNPPSKRGVGKPAPYFRIDPDFEAQVSEWLRTPSTRAMLRLKPLGTIAPSAPAPTTATS